MSGFRLDECVEVCMCGVGLLANLGFDFRSLTLVEVDFVLEGDRNPMHELNTVSPAFTCGLPFSE